MERNNIIAAPQLMDVDATFSLWRRTHSGSRDSFYRFMSTPSVERDEFLAEAEAELIFVGDSSIASLTVIER